MKLNEDNITKLIAFGPFIFVPLIILIIVFFVVKENKTNYEQTLRTIEHDLINSKNQAIKSKIDGIIDLVYYQNSVIEKKLTRKVKDRVITAHKIASKLYDTYKEEKSTQEIQSLIRETIRPLIWNKGDSFIWILNYKGEFQLAPEYLKHLEGSSIINFQDATGRYIIQEEIDIVQNNDSGFMWDTFTKPNDPTKKHYKQVAFVKKFGHYDWYLGSGEYLDTASNISNQEILNSIKKISLDQDEYIFVLNNQGIMLLNNSNKNLIGKNVLQLKVKKTFINMFKLLEKKNHTFLSYKRENPTTKQIENKYSYIKRVPLSSWIIGSGFYESDIKNIAKKQTMTLYQDYNSKIKQIIIFSIISILISFIMSFYISKYLKSSFLKYKKYIEQKSNELVILNQSLEAKVIERTKEIEKQNNIILVQSKVLAVGEMLGNIAHQWRQPLTAINSAMSNIKLTIELDKKMSNEEIIYTADKVSDQCFYLSSTIDDFRNFFNENPNDICEFDAKEAFEETINLVNDSYKNNFIKIVLDLESCIIVENKNTFIQSMINIFNNSKDSIILNNIPTDDRYLFVTMTKEKEKIIINFKDSGGGIKEDVIDKIFEPYFTTKHQSKGTGLGLYMTHQIITTHLEGTICVENSEYEYNGKKLKGAKFIITLPNKQT